MSKTKIFLMGYKIMASIGVHPHEHLAKQLLKVDVELDVSAMASPSDDRIDETLNYEWVADLIENITGQGHVQLIETLISRIADACLVEQQIESVRVRIEKPGAISKADAAGVEILKFRE